VHPDGFDTLEILRGFAAALRASIGRSGLFADGEPLEAVLTWPANANGAQRHVTRAAFRAAGFEVVGTLSEPAAAAIEFADRRAHGNRTAARRHRGAVAVFDFGGGTFDAALVHIDGSELIVLDSAGIEHLGGDDLDAALARLFAQAIGADLETLPRLQRELLRRHACQQKESLSSGTVRTLTLVPADIGLSGAAVTVPVERYVEEIRPLLIPAMNTMSKLLEGTAARRAGLEPEQLDGLYLVGGSSKLPLVSEMLAEHFPGVRLMMTDKPFTATAMGAAIHSTETVTLRDILARHFGVIRLADHGRREYFDPIFPAGMRLPARGAPPVEVSLNYSPRHDIGHLRYLECAAVDAAGLPRAGARAWSDVYFPYDPGIPVDRHLGGTEIHPRDDLAHQTVHETYSCDSDGVITVRLTRSDGQSRVYEVFRG
jgi:molecular chaperone DnaK